MTGAPLLHFTIWSYMWCTLAFSKSRSLPMVDNSLHKHSKDSSSWFLSSFTMQSCMMTSVSILSLKSSPMNLMFPSERLLAWSSASFSSSMSRCFSSCQKSTWWVKGLVVRGWQYYFFSREAVFKPRKLPPSLFSSSQKSHHHLYPFQTPSGNDLAAAYGNSQCFLVCLPFRLEAEGEKVYFKEQLCS